MGGCLVGWVVCWFAGCESPTAVTHCCHKVTSALCATQHADKGVCVEHALSSGSDTTQHPRQATKPTRTLHPAVLHSACLPACLSQAALTTTLCWLTCAPRGWTAAKQSVCWSWHTLQVRGRGGRKGGEGGAHSGGREDRWGRENGGKVAAGRGRERQQQGRKGCAGSDPPLHMSALAHVTTALPANGSACHVSWQMQSSCVLCCAPTCCRLTAPCAAVLMLSLLLSSPLDPPPHTHTRSQQEHRPW